jgi:hypothetical protein
MKTVAELVQDIAQLPAAAQDELSAHLLRLRRRRDDEWRREMARRIDDKNPANWVSLEDLKRRLFPDRTET